MTKTPIKTLLVETDKAETLWVKRALKPHQTGGSNSGTQWQIKHARKLDKAAKSIEAGAFDLLLFGLRSSHENAHQILQRLRKLAPQTSIIVFADADGEHVLKTACTLVTPNGYHKKTSTLKPKPQTIVLPGKTNTAPEEIQSLTPREYQIFKLIAEGHSTKSVAEQLNISVKTAETHRTNLMRKLHIRSVSQLIYYAIRHEVVSV